MKFIDLLSRLLHQYLVACVALVIIPLKFVMVRLSKDRSGEIETILAIPEDVCYVTLGLLISTMSSPGGLNGLFDHVTYPRTDEALLICGNCLLAIFVHKIAQHLTKPQYQHWRAAVEIRLNHQHLDPSETLTIQAAEDNLLYILIHYFSKLLFSLLLQLAAVAAWMYWIATLFKSG
jgi:hypothetical protein